MKVGLALSGGGVRGAVHIGVLKALNEKHIYPDLISGTSAGSMVASLYSVGYSPHEIEEITLKNAKGFAIDFNMGDIFSYVKSLISRNPKKIDGFIKGDKIKKIFDFCCIQKGCVNIKDAKLPIAIPAVDINSAKICMFVSNKTNLIDNEDFCYEDDIDIATAVRASISYPVVFKPCIFKNKKFVDGGVRDNVPVKILKDMGAHRILAVNLGYAGQTDSAMDDILEIAVQCIDIMAYQLSENMAQSANIILKPKVYDVNMFDIKRIPECIERGYRATIDAMPTIKKALMY